MLTTNRRRKLDAFLDGMASAFDLSGSLVSRKRRITRPSTSFDSWQRLCLRWEKLAERYAKIVETEWKKESLKRNSQDNSTQ